MRDFNRSHLAKMLVVAISLGGCSTVDFSQPEIPLSPEYGQGANIHVASFGGSAWFDTPVEGPALSILRDQITYGMVRCSRDGPPLRLDIAADFTERKGQGRSPDHLLGLATWRDPASGRIVGRHHIDIDVFLDHRYAHVSVDSDPEDDWGSSVPRGQLEAGEAFVAQVCEKAFGWSGLAG